MNDPNVERWGGYECPACERHTAVHTWTNDTEREQLDCPCGYRLDRSGGAWFYEYVPRKYRRAVARRRAALQARCAKRDA